MRVMGIDPGLRTTGYGCVATEGVSPTVVEAGVFRLIRGSEARPIAQRLVELERDVSAALERLSPEVVAVEGLFSHYRHPATAIAMGHARGVILCASARAGVRLLELKPKEVKKFLTGSGAAGKSQMQDAVRDRLGLAERPEPADVADALAIALCAASRMTRSALPA